MCPAAVDETNNRKLFPITMSLQDTAKLQELLRNTGVNISADRIYRVVCDAANDPEATASSLVRSLANVIKPCPGNQVLTPVAQDTDRGPATAIIDLLVSEGFLRFDGRRPRVASDPQLPSSGGNTKA